MLAPHDDQNLGVHIETVDDLRAREVQQCPICGIDRDPDRLSEPYCDDACQWLAENAPAPEPRVCVCGARVVGTDGPGRPREHCDDACAARERKRRERDKVPV